MCESLRTATDMSGPPRSVTVSQFDCGAPLSESVTSHSKQYKAMQNDLVGLVFFKSNLFLNNLGKSNAQRWILLSELPDFLFRLPPISQIPSCLAIVVAWIATGEAADDVRTPESGGKNLAAVALKRMGGGGSGGGPREAETSRYCSGGRSEPMG
jgi:hypothetical protein